MNKTYTLFPPKIEHDDLVGDYCDQFNIPFFDDYSSIVYAAMDNGKQIHIDLFIKTQAGEVLLHFETMPSPTNYLDEDFDDRLQEIMWNHRRAITLINVIISIDSDSSTICSMTNTI